MHKEKKVYLHIGHGKTGTTSIQEMLFQNREIFAKNGLLYPEIGLDNFSHHKLANVSQADPTNTTQGIEKSLLEIRDSFLKENYNRLILSTEVLCFAPQQTLDAYYRVFGELDTKIVYYVRQQGQLIESSFLGWAQNGSDYSGHINNYFRIHRDAYDFNLRIKPWEYLFGNKAIEIHLYDKRLFDDACVHFLCCIGLEHLMNKIELFRSNNSLLPNFFGLIHKMDQMNMATKDREEFIGILMELSEQLGNQTKSSLIDEQLMDEIVAEYQDSNRRFADKYLTRIETEYFLAPVSMRK